jgi:hypothetical protein
LPGIAEMDDGAANVEAFEQEAANVLSLISAASA